MNKRRIKNLEDMYLERRDLVIRKKENNNTNFISQNCGITNYYITIILHIKNK
jgi:hypothetical protein